MEDLSQGKDSRVGSLRSTGGFGQGSRRSFPFQRRGRVIGIVAIAESVCAESIMGIERNGEAGRVVATAGLLRLFGSENVALGA